QCWHWFNRRAALQEVLRVLRPHGHLLIAAFDWIPFGRNVVELTEALIEQHNPQQAKPHVRLAMAAGIYPPFVRDLSEGGLSDIETWSYDHKVAYSHAGWRGRIRASQGVGASLSPSQVAAFDAELSALLSREFPAEPLIVPHRVWVAHGRKPA
ncbi:MAG TPA: SAM-dependent methyltransferase, partial [Pseudomonadota bacterium]|nr:SAM-dependent methyltransferase [Pseudomonadota bacterium]